MAEMAGIADHEEGQARAQPPPRRHREFGADPGGLAQGQGDGRGRQGASPVAVDDDGVGAQFLEEARGIGADALLEQLFAHLVAGAFGDLAAAPAEHRDQQERAPPRVTSKDISSGSSRLSAAAMSCGISEGGSTCRSNPFGPHAVEIVAGVHAVPQRLRAGQRIAAAPADDGDRGIVDRRDARRFAVPPRPARGRSRRR
jgi:hypothetical protein